MEFEMIGNPNYKSCSRDNDYFTDFKCNYYRIEDVRIIHDSGLILILKSRNMSIIRKYYYFVKNWKMRRVYREHIYVYDLLIIQFKYWTRAPSTCWNIELLELAAADIALSRLQSRPSSTTPYCEASRVPSGM